MEDEVYGFLDEVDGLEPLLVAEHPSTATARPLVWARPSAPAGW